MSDMQGNNSNIFEEDDISFKDIIDFLVENWKTIFVSGILGLVISLVFVFSAPVTYEAKAQIKMAQIGVINNNNNVTPLGVNIEEPALLIARMKLPSSFNPMTIDRCGITGEKDAQHTLANLVKLSAVKGVPSVVELSIQASTKEKAYACVTAVFDLIKSSQLAILEPLIDQTKAQLMQHQKRLDESRGLMSRADKSGSTLSTAYLVTRDEVNYLMNEVIRLQNFINSANTGMTRLTAPIYANDNPVFPKKKISVFVGLVVGLFLGLLFAMIRQVYQKKYLNQN